MKPSKRQNPWIEWTDRDDRGALNDLAERGFSTPACYEVLHDLLHLIVTSLHFGSQSRWGLSARQSEVKKISLSLLDWMRERGEWDSVKKAWAADDKGPWSLPFFISRACWRHREATQKVRVPVSRGGMRGSLDFSSPDHQAAGLTAIAGGLFEAFASMTHQLSRNLRLPYQLHLEGLLDLEIAELLGRDVTGVRRSLNQARQQLLTDVKDERKTGT